MYAFQLASLHLYSLGPEFIQSWAWMVFLGKRAEAGSICRWILLQYSAFDSAAANTEAHSSMALSC